MDENTKPTPGALRAAVTIWNIPRTSVMNPDTIARIIDRETGLRDLLSACEEAEDCLMRVTAADHLPNTQREGLIDLRGTVQAAIAKARGEG